MKQMDAIKMIRMGTIKMKWMGRMNEISILKKFIWVIKWYFGFGKEKLGSQYSSYIKLKLIGISTILFIQNENKCINWCDAVRWDRWSGLRIKMEEV